MAQAAGEWKQTAKQLVDLSPIEKWAKCRTKDERKTQGQLRAVGKSKAEYRAFTKAICSQ
jgi:hypothetical protein